MNERTRGTTESAMSAVRKCADATEAQASHLLQSLPGLPMPEALRANALELAAVVRRLSGLDAVMMNSVAAATGALQQSASASGI